MNILLRSFVFILTVAFLSSCGSEPTDTVVSDKVDNGNIGGGAVSFNNPRAIARDPNGDYIVADFATGDIIWVDGKTGDRELLSDNTNPAQGPAFSQPAGAVVLPDGRIFIADLALNAVIEVDPKEGTRTLLAGGDGISIRQPFGITFGRVNGADMLIVADIGSPRSGQVIGPVLVDPETGAITHIPVPDDNTLSYNDPRSIVLHEESGKFFVGNFGVGSIFEVDTATGQRRLISRGGPDPVGDGPGFSSITDMALAADGKSVLVVDLGRESVINVNLSTGDRTIVTQSFGEIVGAGFDFRVPHGVSLFPGGMMITDFGLPGVVHVSANGDRTAFSATPTRGFGQIRGIDLLSDGSLVAADFAGERVIGVDIHTGVRTVISGDGRGSGPALNGPVSVDQLDDETLVVSDFGYLAIFFIDRVTGDRSFVTGPGSDGRGTGPAVGSRGIIIDPLDPSRILATDFALDAVIAIDIATGNRSIFSSAITDTPRGDGPPLNNPFGIDIAEDGTVYVSDMGLQAVVRIDRDGNRTIVTSNDGTGTGPKLASPWGIRLIDGEILVGDAKGIFRIDEVTGDREIVSPVGPIFTLRKLEGGRMAISSIGAVNGIEISDAAYVRSILSNADHP